MPCDDKCPLPCSVYSNRNNRKRVILSQIVEEGMWGWSWMGAAQRGGGRRQVRDDLTERWRGGGGQGIENL
jgi:hypothetical protein